MRLSPSRRAVALSAAAVVLPLLPALLAGAPASAAAPSSIGFTDAIAGRAAVVRGTDLSRASTVARTPSRAQARVNVTQTREGARSSVIGLSTINVNFSGGDVLQQAAFNRAAQTWANLIQSPVPIEIDVTLAAQEDEDVLGSAGPTNLYSRGTAFGEILANTFYPAALANALVGRDDNPGAEIAAEFNSDPTVFSFSPGAPAAGTYDFETVALHEIGHGLGFLGNMGVFEQGGRLLGGWDVDELSDRTPFIFDRRVVRTSPAPVKTLFGLGQDSPALAQALTTGDVGFGGPNLTDLRPCQPIVPRLYTPSTFVEGTSYSHLDEASFGPGSANSLMTPFINEQEVVRDPGPIALAMLRDMGWKAERRAFSSVLQQCAPASANVGATVTLQGTAPAGSTVSVFFRMRTETQYAVRRTLLASATGRWTTTFGAVDDWAYAVASSDGQSTPPKVTVAKPTVPGATVRSFRRGTTVTISGKGIANSTMSLRFRLQSTRTAGYPILRNVRVAANGTWTYRTTLTQHHQFFGTGVNGQRTATYLYRAV